MREQVAERTRGSQAGRCGGRRGRRGGRASGELYEELGAYVVDGGETFNPSIYDLLAAIHEVPSEEVVVLPNNPNVVMAAERAAELSDKQARVVPCTSQQAGLVAMVEIDPALSVEENAERLGAALDEVRIGSVAPAARDDAQGRFAAGDAVGFVGDEIVAWGGAGSTLAETMAQLGRGRRDRHGVGGDGAPIPLAELEGHAPDGRRGRAPRRAASRTTGGCWPRSDAAAGPTMHRASRLAFGADGGGDRAGTGRTLATRRGRSAAGEPLDREALLAAPVRSPRPAILDAPLTKLKGAGPKLSEAAAEIGVSSLGDLLRHLPHSYRDRASPVGLGGPEAGGGGDRRGRGHEGRQGAADPAPPADDPRGRGRRRERRR